MVIFSNIKNTRGNIYNSNIFLLSCRVIYSLKILREFIHGDDKIKEWNLAGPFCVSFDLSVCSYEVNVLKSKKGFWVLHNLEKYDKI